MTDLLEKTTTPEVAERTTPKIPRGPAPPDRVSTPPWPTAAKALVVILTIAAILGAIGTVIGFTTGDEGTTDTARITEMQGTIDSLTAERDQLQASYDAINADLASQQQATATARALTAATRQQLADVTQRMIAANTAIATVTMQRDNLRQVNLNLALSLTGQRDQLATVQAQRDALAELFPMRFDASLDGVALAGTYDVKFDEVYCEGFGTCGALPPVDEIVIQETPEGWLRLMLPGFTSAGLYRVDGALYAITDSNAAAFACGATPRLARVAVTMFAHGISVADDGTRQITDLSGSVTVQAPAAAGCPAGLAFYGVGLSPQS